MRLSVIKTLVKTYSKGLKNEIQADMQYKTDFYFYIVKLVLSTLMSFAMVEIVYAKIPEINGWTKADFYLLTSLFNCGAQIFLLLSYGIIEIPGDIKSGYFDRSLLRPLPLIHQYLMQNKVLYYIPDLIGGLVMFLYALHLGAGINPALLLYSITFGGILYFAISLFIVTINFYANIQANTQNLIGEITNFGKVPPSFYPTKIRIFLTFIFPIFASGGAVFMVQKKEIPQILLINITIVVLAFLYFSLKFWNYSIRRYTSAGS